MSLNEDRLKRLNHMVLMLKGDLPQNKSIRYLNNVAEIASNRLTKNESLELEKPSIKVQENDILVIFKYLISEKNELRKAALNVLRYCDYHSVFIKDKMLGMKDSGFGVMDTEEMKDLFRIMTKGTQG